MDRAKQKTVRVYCRADLPKPARGVIELECDTNYILMNPIKATITFPSIRLKDNNG